MMAFAPPPHPEHRQTMVGGNYIRSISTPTQLQEDQMRQQQQQQGGTVEQSQNTIIGKNQFILKGKNHSQIGEEEDDDLYKPRQTVFSPPPPRPIRSNVRPAAEMRNIRKNQEEQMSSLNEEISEEEEEEEDEYPVSQSSSKLINGERSMSLDESSGFDQYNQFIRPRIESAPSENIKPYRPRSHFSIPDIAIISSEEEGNEIHYELQFEQSKRRMNLTKNESISSSSSTTTTMISPSSSKSTIASNEGQQTIKVQPIATKTASNKAKAQLATFTFPPSSINSSTNSVKSKKVFNKSIKSQNTPSIRIFDSEGQDQKINNDLNETIKSINQNVSQKDDFNFPPITKLDSSNSEKGINENTISNKIGKRLRKSSLPNLFGKKEREAANLIAIQALPKSTLPNENIQKQSLRQSSDPIVMKKSKDDNDLKSSSSPPNQMTTSTIWQRRMNPDQQNNGLENKDLNKSRVVPPSILNQNSPDLSLIQSSPPLSPRSPTQPFSPLKSFFNNNNDNGGNKNTKSNQPVNVPNSIPSPSSPTFSFGRPSSTSSLTKKEIKQKQKEEKNLIKELEKVDKMVRKHDQKAMKAQKKAEEKLKKEEKKIQQISGPISVSILPSSNPATTMTNSPPPNSTTSNWVNNSPITLSTLDSNHIQSDSSSTSIQTSESNILTSSIPFDSPTTTVASRSDGQLYNQSDETDDVNIAIKESIPDDDDDQQSQSIIQTTREPSIVKPLKTSSSVAPRISLPPSSATTFSLFDSLYKEVDAMETSFGYNYPTEAEERRKSVIKTHSVPQSPTLL